MIKNSLMMNFLAKGDNAEYLTPQPLDELLSNEWPHLDKAALYGLAGDVVRTIEPHTEADLAAILVQYLTAFGNAVGSTPYYPVESDKHRANLFVVLVGDSAKARKGTSWGRVRDIMAEADADWSNSRIKGGLSSGEGFIYEVRDPVTRWNAKDSVEEVVDPGVHDKRLLCVEPEFATVLTVTERNGNTLSQQIRQAWDGSKLGTLTKTSPLTATGAHVSIVAHITVDELRTRLTRTDIANGFGNRFLFALARRSRELPFGGNLSESEITDLGERTRQALDNARSIGRIEWTKAAADKWRSLYGKLSEAKPGLLGAIIARSEAQVVRLAMLYTLLDGKGSIEISHLKAALAVWEYCEASAVHIFGSLLGDPVADNILAALKRAGSDGMTRTAIRDLFGRHQSADRIGAALGLLSRAGKAHGQIRMTGGRPIEAWFETSEQS